LRHASARTGTLDRHTDRHTDTLIAILRTPPAGKVKQLVSVREGFYARITATQSSFVDRQSSLAINRRTSLRSRCFSAETRRRASRANSSKTRLPVDTGSIGSRDIVGRVAVVCATPTGSRERLRRRRPQRAGRAGISDNIRTSRASWVCAGRNGRGCRALSRSLAVFLERRRRPSPAKRE